MLAARLIRGSPSSRPQLNWSKAAPQSSARSGCHCNFYAFRVTPNEGYKAELGNSALWFPSHLEVARIGVIGKFALQRSLQIVRDRTTKRRTMIQDYKIDVVRVYERQRALSSPGRIFVEIKKDAGWIAKAREKVDLRRIGFGQDVFTASMLVDKAVQCLVLARACSGDTQAPCARHGKPNCLGVRCIFSAQVINEPRRQVEHDIHEAEAHHAGHG